MPTIDQDIQHAGVTEATVLRVLNFELIPLARAMRSALNGMEDEGGVGDVQTFTAATGTWTKPTSFTPTIVRVVCTGGGNDTPVGQVFTAGALGATEPVVVGGAGSPSTFGAGGTLVTAPGGSGTLHGKVRVSSW